MNTDARNHNPSDPLWELLGKAKAVEVSPFFARNVLREIRLTQTQTPAPGWTLLALIKRGRVALACCAVVCIVAATSTVLLRDNTNPLALRSGDAEVIRNLDELLAYERSALWLNKHVY